MIFFKLSIFSTVLFLSGCQALLPERSSKEHISELEVLGIWKMNKSTVDIVKRENKFDSSLGYTFELLPDSKCNFNSIIVWRFKPSDLKLKYCKWELNHDVVLYKENKQTNQLLMTISNTPFHLSSGIKCSENDSIKSRQTTVKFDIAKVNEKISFFKYYGDPDTCEYIEYETVRSPKKKS